MLADEMAMLGAAPPIDPTFLPPDPLTGGMMPPADPLMGGVPGAGMPPMGMPPMGPQFPSTDPGMLAQAVQDALAQLAQQDHQMLEMQQQQAAMQAQPIIDQMMMQAATPPPPALPGMGLPPEADPMMAFGEGLGMPPLPPEAMVA